jgi:hypothetical protein
MITKTLIACALVAATVAVHAVGLAQLMTSWLKSHALPPSRPWPITWFLIRITWLLLLIHATEIVVWALFYWWQGCLPDLASATYFSGVTYATVGYGDLVLPEEWRMLAPIEGLTGILMCGLSAGLFFAIVNRLFGTPFEEETP